MRLSGNLGPPPSPGAIPPLRAPGPPPTRRRPPPRSQMSVRNCFIRGSVVRYINLPADSVDTELLHDATRREARGG